MSRIAIPVTAYSLVGVAPPAQTDADATRKHSLANPSSRTVLEVVSSDAGDQTVTFELAGIDPNLLDGAATPTIARTIPAGATRGFGPFAKAKYNSPAIAADQLLTSDGTAPANNDSVTIDGHVYTYKTTLTGAANEVLIGANAAAALSNLEAAINDDSGVEGTNYGTGTTAHGTVTATTLTSTTLLVVAKSAGTSGNALATTKTSAHLSWGAATLAGGIAADTAILIDPSVSTTLKFRAYSI